MKTQLVSRIIIVRGVPGSGKSHISGSLAESLNATCLLDPDVVALEGREFVDFSNKLSSEGIDKKFHLYRFSRSQAYNAIEQGRDVVWNQPFIDFNGLELTLTRLEQHAETSNTTLRILVIDVVIDHSLAAARVQKRISDGGHGPDKRTLERFFAEYKSFAGRGYETVEVDGADSIEKSLSTIAAAIK